jgi:hypothetical protein
VEVVGRRTGRGRENTRGQQALSGLCPRRSVAVWCGSVAVWCGSVAVWCESVASQSSGCSLFSSSAQKLLRLSFLLREAASLLLSSLVFGRSWKPTVERSSDSTLDTGEMELSGRDRAAKGGQVGWGVCRVRENLVAGLGWVVVLCCEGSAKRKRRGGE